MPLYPAENEHKRVLSESEGDVLYKRMALVWGIKAAYWWPLSEPRPPHAEAFQDYYFENELGYPALRGILAALGSKTIFEFREGGKAYAVSVATFEPRYELERFWTSADCDWIIYASHEGSVTVGGERLLPAVKEAWPSWERRVWTMPFFSTPTTRSMP